MAFRRDRFRELREKLGSREKLAGKINSTGTTIYNWEMTETEPGLFDLIKAVEVLGTTLAYIMDETDDPSPDALKRMPTEEDLEKVGFRGRASDTADELIPPENMDSTMKALWYEFIAKREFRKYVESLTPRPTGTKNSNPGEGSPP